MTSVLIFNDSGAWVIIFQYVNIIEYELSMRDMHSFEKRVRNVDFPTRGIYRLTFVLAKRIMIIKSFVDSTSLSTYILKDKGRWTIPFSRYWKKQVIFRFLFRGQYPKIPCFMLNIRKFLLRGDRLPYCWSYNLKFCV